MLLLIRDKIILVLFEDCKCNNHVSKMSPKSLKKTVDNLDHGEISYHTYYMYERRCSRGEISMYLWIVAAFIAYLIKGLCGFANTLVFTSVLSFGESNANISPVDLLLGYPMNLILVWRNRKNLDLKIYGPLAALVLLGSIPGALLLKNMDVKAIKLVFGLIVIILGTEMFLQEYRGKNVHSSKPALAFVGLIAGVACGLFGVGALLAVYISRVTENSNSFKANISAVFIVENSFRIIFYYILGLLTLNTLKSALLLTPFALLGLLTGMKFSNYLDEKFVRKFTSVMLVLSGIALILKNL